MVITSPTVNLGSWDQRSAQLYHFPSRCLFCFATNIFYSLLFFNEYLLIAVTLQPKNCMFNIQGRAIASESLKDEEVRVTPCHLHDFLKTNSSSAKKSRFVIISFVFNLVDSLPAQFCFIVLFRQRFPPTQHPPPFAIPLHHLPKKMQMLVNK